MAPKFPIKIVFDAYHLYHLPQFDPVIDLLKKDKRFDVYLTTCANNHVSEMKLTQEILNQKGCKTIFASNEEERKKMVTKLKPDVFICGWSRYDLDQFVPDETLVGMIYHGIGIKPSYWEDNHERLDIRFVEGPYRERQLRSHGIKTSLGLTGFAKLDPLFNRKESTQAKVSLILKLDPEKKTILYAPTFYPSSMEKFGFSLAEQTCNYNLIIKLHMWTYFKPFGKYDLKKQINLAHAMEKEFLHVHVLKVSDYNIAPYLSLADVLLTEASSTIYEMLALNKPVIMATFFHLRYSHRFFRKRLYHRRLNSEMSKEAENLCIVLDRPKNLTKVLDQALNPNSECRENDSPQLYMDDLFYKRDGKVSERIRKEILIKLSLFKD